MSSLTVLSPSPANRQKARAFTPGEETSAAMSPMKATEDGSSAHEFDPDFEFDALKYCDFDSERNCEKRRAKRKADTTWFDRQHPLHEPPYTPGDPECLVSPSPPRKRFRTEEKPSAVSVPVDDAISKDDSVSDLIEEHNRKLKAERQEAKDLQSLISSHNKKLMHKPVRKAPNPPPKVEVSSSSMSFVQATSKKAKPLSDATNKKPQVAIDDADDLAALLSAHNKKVSAGKHTYVPPAHSQKWVREWEKETGKRWHNLTPTERMEANEHMSRLKAKSVLDGSAAAKTTRPTRRK